MQTRVIVPEADDGFMEAVRAAVEVMQGGGMAAFPTETVYGVGVRADDPDALERLRLLKTRDAQKAFTVHISTREEVARYVPHVPGIAARLIRKAWPGPLTLILPVEDPQSAPIMRGPKAPDADALYYDQTIGLRCPDDPFALALLSGIEAPVVATSANLAGNPPPWTGKAVLADLDGRIDLLIDTGRTKYARPSTIVRVNEAEYEVVREGVLDKGSIDRMTTIRLLFVCSGNTCRSPMAAGIARKMLAERLGCSPADLARRGVVVTSAGSSPTMTGPAANAVTVMKKWGINISDHVVTELRPDMIQQADHVYVMTRAHRARVLELVPAADSKVELVVEGVDVPDPVGSSVEDYERCARTIEEGLRARLREVSV